MSATTSKKRQQTDRPLLMRTIDLGPAQVLAIEPAHTDMRVRVLHGRVWLTEEGALQDVFACSGDEVALRAKGLTVIEGLSSARVQILDCGKPVTLVRIALWLTRIGDSLRRFAGRLWASSGLGPVIR